MTSNTRIAEMIEYYDNNALRKITLDSTFKPNALKSRNKDLVFVSVFYNNYEAFEMLVTHKNFDKKGYEFVNRIIRRIIKCDCFENRKYLDLLFQIGFNFERNHLMQCLDNSNIFIEIFNNIINNNNDIYQIISELFSQLFNYTINITTQRFLYDYIKNNYSEYFTKEKIDTFYLKRALRDNNICIVEMIEPDFDILYCCGLSSILYIINNCPKDLTLLNKICKLMIQSNIKYEGNLMIDLKFSIYDFNYFYQHNSWQSCNKYINMLNMIVKNYDLLKQCYNIINDKQESNFIHCNLVYMIVLFINSHYKCSMKEKESLELNKTIEFLLQNKITTSNPFPFISRHEEDFKKNINIASQSNINYIEMFRKIFIIIMKYGYKPETNKILTLFFKEEELKNIDSLLITEITVEEKKKPKRKTVVKKNNIEI